MSTTQVRKKTKTDIDTKTQKPLERRYYQTPNSKLALAVIQLQNTTFKGLKLEFLYNPKCYDKYKIMAMIMSKMTKAYNVKTKTFKDDYIFINIDELKDLEIADPMHPARDLDKIKQCVKAIFNTSITKEREESKGEDEYHLFSSKHDFMIDGKIRGYYLVIDHINLPVVKIWRGIMNGYGNAPRWIFKLSKDAFLVAYYLLTHQSLSKGTSYSISLDSIQEYLDWTTRAKNKNTDKRQIYPKDRIREAIQGINDFKQDSIKIFENDKKTDFYNVVVKRESSQKLKFLPAKT